MKELMVLFQAHFMTMCKTGILFKSSMTGREVWDLYLSSFEEEDDPVFRDPESSSHNCNHCNSFIRRYGNIVALDKDMNLVTLFDIAATGEYTDTFKIVSAKLKKETIGNVFIESFDMLNKLPYESCKRSNDFFRLGTAKNHKRYTKAEAELYGVVKPNEVRVFNHFHLDLPKKFVDMSGDSIESIQGFYKSNKDVFYRGMREIPLDTLKLVKDLILQGSLLDGTAFLPQLKKFLKLKKEFDKIPSDKQEMWCWITSNKLPIAKFRNTLMGVLCTELAEGENLNKACLNWNKNIDPAKYMKATSPITKTQKKNAEKFVVENGYIESFDRRFATMDDIKASEIQHINVGDGKIKEVSIFDDIKTTSSRHKRNEFKGIEEVSIEKFMKDILPGCTSVEAFLENRMSGNLVTMTKASQDDCKQLFKWNNPYSWTYQGNLAGKTSIKKAVKSQGGKVDGVLRFSIMWSQGDSKDDSDLDAHCIEPGGNRIYFSNPKNNRTGGNLDIDIQNPLSHKRNNKDVVENITYPDLNKMDDGAYDLIVRQYSADNSQGFAAEVEFNGELHEYAYDRPVKGDIKVATVTLKNGEFSIVHHLPSTSSSKPMYGLDSQQFHKVDLMCLSPNYWGENNVGKKHYFFMLDGCKPDSDVVSFHTENLHSDLVPHRKVLEVLSTMRMLEPVDKCLAGIGFNSTVKDELIVRLKGNFKRIIKIKF